MRSEKGSITLYVLLAMLTLTAFLMAIYIKNSNTEMAQVERTKKIKSIYEDYNIDEVYTAMKNSVPIILDYTRGINSVTIKTLEENGASVDQNGKEILFYAATESDIEPTEEALKEGTFGKWQKSKKIIIPSNVADVFLWIKNEDQVVSVSKKAEKIVLSPGDYTGDLNKEYTDEDGETAYIPAGFTISDIKGEKKISEGLVIYSGQVQANEWKDADGDGIIDAQKKYNQYVWIPIENADEMYGIVTKEDTNLNPNKGLVVGEKYGKLYFKTVTDKNSHYNWPSDGGYSNTAFREPTYLENFDYADDGTYNQDASGAKIITKEGIKKEFDNMIKSIETYHGFYIGRYELTGTVDSPSIVRAATPLTANMAYSVNGKLTWYGLYTQCQKLEPDNNKVYTSMIWGSQWDQAIKRSLEFDPKFLEENAKLYGVYNDSTTTNQGVSGRMDAAYNIYDMGGNVWDWTIEADYHYFREKRGGAFNRSYIDFPASKRNSNNPITNYSDTGCRAQLYIH